MSKCLLCGVKDIRQPALPGEVYKFYVVQISKGGKKAPHNQIDLCRYHEVMYHKWFSDTERAIAEKVIRKKMRETFPKWEKEYCVESEYKPKTLLSKIMRRIKHED